jgi:hypothetical protein
MLGAVVGHYDRGDLEKLHHKAASSLAKILKCDAVLAAVG